MKKTLSIILTLVLLLGVIGIFASCQKQTYEIAIVTDVGQLMDKGFNQGTYEGAKAYAEANGIGYKYYQPANGSDATDNDRIDAMKQAINNGAKIIVAPGFLQASAMETVAKENPDVKFVFVDGWALGLSNVTAIVYKEQESGYLAGYAAVADGYTKLGYTGGGGGANPACCRFGYGFVQGAEAAAKELGVDVSIMYSFKYGETFACGGSLFQSVKSAAGEYENAKIIGVDVDQSGESEKVITSAIKGLSESVELVIGQYYAGKWDTELAERLRTSALPKTPPVFPQLLNPGDSQSSQLNSTTHSSRRSRAAKSFLQPNTRLMFLSASALTEHRLPGNA